MDKGAGSVARCLSGSRKNSPETVSAGHDHLRLLLCSITDRTMPGISHTPAAWRKYPDQMKLSRSQNSIAFVDTRDTENHGKMKVNPV